MGLRLVKLKNTLCRKKPNPVTFLNTRNFNKYKSDTLSIIFSTKNNQFNLYLITHTFWLKALKNRKTELEEQQSSHA